MEDQILEQRKHMIEDIESAINEMENPVTYCNHRNCDGSEHRKNLIHKAEFVKHADYNKTWERDGDVFYEIDTLRRLDSDAIRNNIKGVEQKYTEDSYEDLLPYEVRDNKFIDFVIVDSIYEVEAIGKIERIVKKIYKATEDGEYIGKPQMKLIPNGTYVHMVIWI